MHEEERGRAGHERHRPPESVPHLLHGESARCDAEQRNGGGRHPDARDALPEDPDRDQVNVDGETDGPSAIVQEIGGEKRPRLVAEMVMKKPPREIVLKGLVAEEKDGETRDPGEARREVHGERKREENPFEPESSPGPGVRRRHRGRGRAQGAGRLTGEPP